LARSTTGCRTESSDAFWFAGVWHAAAASPSEAAIATRAALFITMGIVVTFLTGS
jgi:hypothetical protein